MAETDQPQDVLLVWHTATAHIPSRVASNFEPATPAGLLVEDLDLLRELRLRGARLLDAHRVHVHLAAQVLLLRAGARDLRVAEPRKWEAEEYCLICNGTLYMGALYNDVLHNGV